MEKYISKLSIVLKEFQKKEKIPDVIMVLILNELVAMKLRVIFTNQLNYN